MWRLALILLVGALGSILAISTVAAGEFPSSPNLCVLPVLRGSPGEGDLFSLGRMNNRPTVIPGLPGPILHGGNRGGIWTIADGLYQPYGGEFPQSVMWDRFAVDADSGRVIGLGRGGKIYAAEPGNRTFRRLASLDDSGRLAGSAIAYIAHRHAVMVWYDNSLYRLEGDKPVLVTDKLPFPAGSFNKLTDLPRQSAVLIANGAGDIAFVRDDGSAEMMMHQPIKGADQTARAVIETADPLRVLVGTLGKLLIIDPTRPAGERVEILPIPEGSTFRLGPDGWDSMEFVSNTANGTFIIDEQGLERLGPEGLTPVSNDPAARAARRIINMPSLGFALVPEAPEAVYAFDGRTLSPIPGLSGGMFWDLPSIGKVLVSTTKGLFEITPQRTLVPIALPGPHDPEHGIQIVEMPQAHAAIILDGGRVYAIDRDGIVSTVPGGEQMGFSSGLGTWPIGVLSPANELLFEGLGQTSLYRVVDRRTAGAEACAPADQPRPTVSTLCFRQIEGADDRHVDDFYEWVLAPTRDRLFVRSRKGLFQITQNRIFGRIPELAPEISGELFDLPWENAVFINGRQGSSNFILRENGSLQKVVDKASNPAGLLQSHLVLPALKTVLFGDTPGLSFYLTQDGAIAKLTNDAGRGAFFSDYPVEAPWLGGAVVPSWPLGWWKPGEPVSTLPLDKPYARIYLATLPYTTRHEVLYPVSRFRTVLMPAINGFKRLTEDLRIVDVPGVDRTTRLVLAQYDSGAGDILIGTSTGLYRLSEQGSATFVPQVGVGAVRVLLHSSAIDGVIAGSEYGLFRMRNDGGATAIAQGDAITIGTVYRAIDVPWARLTLIGAARGIYVLDQDGVLTKLDASEIGDPRFDSFAAFPTLRGVFTRGKGASYPTRGAIYELGRRSADTGSCTAPL